MKKIIGIIPARMGSSRFPGKPMKNIEGIPMIGHCYFRAKLCDKLDEVYVATCDKEIYDYIKSINGNVVMTSNEHERASDRTAEALLKAEKITGNIFDIVVLLQGDEPMTKPSMIEMAIAPLLIDKNIKISNLFTKIRSVEEFNNPNEVKVVVDNNNFAIYFSREPIPSRKMKHTDVPMYKQVCVIPFEREFLIKYNDLPQTKLEIIESVDMLRVIENGIKIKMIYIEDDNYSVDTEEDLINVKSIMKNDNLISKYK
jgi:3-deoxy-manno-octulosonate cytidylyltransferase (CMP-KDO synthetase)